MLCCTRPLQSFAALVSRGGPGSALFMRAGRLLDHRNRLRKAATHDGAGGGGARHALRRPVGRGGPCSARSVSGWSRATAARPPTCWPSRLARRSSWPGRGRASTRTSSSALPRAGAAGSSATAWAPTASTSPRPARAGLAVARVSDYGTEAVAFHAVSLVTALLRRLREADAAVRAGEVGRRRPATAALAEPADRRRCRLRPDRASRRRPAARARLPRGGARRVRRGPDRPRRGGPSSPSTSCSSAATSSRCTCPAAPTAPR